MAEKTLTEVIERLKTEGQLTRNTGANSIKSVKIVLSSVLEEQTTILQNILNSMTKQTQIEETRTRLGRAEKDVIGGDARKTDTRTPSILSSIFAPAREEGLRLGGIILAPIIAPLKGLLRILRVGGPIGIAVGLLWAVFRDIGENEGFITALENIRKVWNEDILPTFERIRGIFNNIIQSDLVTSIMENTRRDIITLQKFIINIMNNSINTIKGLLEGLNMILDGDVVGGIKNIVGSIISGLFGAVDSLATTVLELFGIDFGEDGTLGTLIKRRMSEFFTAFEEKWNNLVDFFHVTIPDALGNVIELFKSLFADPVEALSQLWNSIVGDGGLIDILYMPINKTIDWITKKFGWREEDAPEFSIQDIIGEWVDSVKAWVTDIFSFLPSVDDIKKSLLSALPEWARNLIVSEDVSEDDARRNLIQREIDDLRSARSDAMISAGQFGQIADTSSMDEQIRKLEEDLLSFRSGSKGFMDFGLGTPAILHGIEAVVPINTPAGKFLAQNFDNNFQPIMNKIAGMESAALQGNSAPIVIANAPTIAPVNNNISGPTNVSSQRYTAIGENSGSGMGRFAN